MLRPGGSPPQHFISAYQENLPSMKHYPTRMYGGIVLPVSVTHRRTCSPDCWILYGLTLDVTPFADERVIRQHIEAISLCDAVNFLVEKYALGTYRPAGFSACTSQLMTASISPGSRATGLIITER